ncbi:MAG: DNA translocase FtsK 4TM domain-containing protein, partial [Acidobacteriota bacterium]
MSSSAVSTRTGTPRTLPKLPISAEKGNEIIGFVLAALAALLLGSLLSYDPRDPSWLHHTLADDTQTRNFIGPFGAQLAAIVFGLIGVVSLAVPGLLGIEAWRRLTRRPRAAVPGRNVGTGAMLVVTPALAQLLLGEIPWQSSTIDAGGAIGVVLSEFLASKLNSGGAFVVLLTVLLVAGSLVARSTLGDVLGRGKEFGGGSWQRVELWWAQRAKKRRE